MTTLPGNENGTVAKPVDADDIVPTDAEGRPLSDEEILDILDVTGYWTDADGNRITPEQVREIIDQAAA